MAGRRKKSAKAERWNSGGGHSRIRGPVAKTSRPPRGGRGRRLFPWLVLGGVGLVAALWRRSDTPPRGGEPGRRPRPAVEPESLEVAPDLTLPPTVDEAWIPGPGGALRMAQVNPGADLAVVFVHGLGGRLEHWAPMLTAAGPGLRAVAFDLPGHGGSDLHSENSYTVGDLAGALGAVVDNLGLRRTVLVGHSLGASVIAEYASTHPRRVLGLLLVDPNGDQTRLAERQRRDLVAALTEDPRAELAWQFRQVLHAAQPEIADRVLEDLEATDARVLLEMLVASLDYSPLPALEAYGGPTRSVISDLNDLPHSLHRLLPELPVRFVGDASHWLMLDRCDDFWELLIDFLDSIV